MNYIKLFLASSIVEFEREREELRAYIKSLNDIYVRRDIYFELIACEDLPKHVAKDRKQEEYNAHIRDSQYFYLLIGTEARDYTVEEFDVALEAFRAGDAPKINAYFLQLPDTQPPSQSVLDFMERVDRELEHFHCTFTHIDTVKLELLLDLCRDPLAGGQVKLEDGWATLDGQPVLSMENIPLYSKNEGVQNLLAEKGKLDEEFAALAALGDSEAVRRMRLEKDAQRNKIAEQLHALEMDVLGLYTEISEKRQLGRRLNWREKKAIEYVDAGNYDAAKAVLRDKLWREEVKQAEEVIDGEKERIREYISGQMMLIRTLKASGVTEESEQEILSVYEEIAKLAEKHQIELDVLYDYAGFLWKQKHFPEGIRVAERLRNLYGLVEGVTENKTANLLNLLGLLYSNNREFQKAEAIYREALEIRRRLAQNNPAAYEPSVAMTCNNLAILLKDTNRYDEAEKLFREALEIRRRLAQNNPAAYEPVMAETCNNLAILLKDTNRRDEAEKLFREALEIRRLLAQDDPAAYEPVVAGIYNNLSSLLYDTNRHDEAEKLYRESLEICRRLAKGNPAAYEPDVAKTCNNLAILLVDTNRHDEAEKLYREALAIRRRLAQDNPAAYEPDVAMTCNNLAILLDDTNRHDEAEKLYREALEIYRRLAQGNLAAYEPDVAVTSNNLALLLADISRYDEAEKLYRETLEIWRRLVQGNPAAYEPDVADTCNNLAILLVDSNRHDEAEKLFREALEIYRRLAQGNPAAYELVVAGICNNLANLLKNTNRHDVAEKLYWEALEIRRRLARGNPDTYKPAVAKTCFNLGIFQYNVKRDKEATRACFEEASPFMKRTHTCLKKPKYAVLSLRNISDPQGQEERSLIL